jgi:O-antigen ligase
LCYFISLIIFIFFLNNANLKYKIKWLLNLIILPILLYFSIASFVNKFTNENEKISNRIFETHSSGRIELWTYSIKENDYSKIFGYGIQGDRFFLKKFEKSKIYGNNSSNIFIYTLLSGGVISVIILLLFYFELFNFFLKNRKKIFFKNNSLYFNFSIVCLVFLLIRSNFENSFGLFSLDFLIMYLSLMYIIKILQNFKIQMRNIKISIITTCKNSDKHIAYTLSSVSEQTYKNIRTCNSGCWID